MESNKYRNCKRSNKIDWDYEVKSLENETWYQIVGFEDAYMVSDKNRVKSLRRYISRTDGRIYERPEMLRKIHSTEDGYLQVRLSKYNKSTSWLLHRLIAISAIPNPQELREVNHKDGNKLNNNVSNLEWCYHRYNMIHAVQNSLMNYRKGENSASSKLTTADVISIKNSNSSGLLLAEKYKVSPSTISAIRAGRTWNTITGLPMLRKSTIPKSYNTKWT